MQRIMQGSSKMNRLMIIVAAFAVLCAVAAVCLLRASAGEPTVGIELIYNGSRVASLDVPENEKYTLTAQAPSGVTSTDYQWQINVGNDTWVDIDDCDTVDIDVSYALVESVLDEKHQAEIRCVLISDGVIELTSEACVVTVVDAVESSEEVFDDGAYVSEGYKVSTPTDVQVSDVESTTDKATGAATTDDETAVDVTTEDTAQSAISTSMAASRKSAARLATANNTAASLAEEDGTPILITINYLDGEDGNSIYGSYTANITSNQTFNQVVSSATYVGYTPYYDSNKPDADKDTFKQLYTAYKGNNNINNGVTSASNITISYNPTTSGMITINGTSYGISDSKVTINVYYEAAKVPYAAHYFFQETNTDYYKENTALRKFGYAYTGDIVDDNMLAPDVSSDTLTGFVKLYHYPEAVAADGSTVFECYYDRIYTLIDFDLDGGYGVQPLYGRYGAAFAVNTPVKYGYNFAGWDLVTGQDSSGNDIGDGEADTLPTAIPAKNCKYIALWMAIDTTYTEVYWLQDPDAEDSDTFNAQDYNYWGSRTKNASSGTKVTGTALAENTKDLTVDTPVDSWYTDISRYVDLSDPFEYDTDVVVAGDGSTVVNVYYKRKTYTLKFFYARESYTSTNSSHSWSVVGGCTYTFSGYSGSTYPEIYYRNDGTDGTKNMYNKCESTYTNGYNKVARTVAGEPTVNGSYAKGCVVKNSSGTYIDYDDGNVPSSEDYTAWYYIEFDAHYGQNISNLWPANPFKPVSFGGSTVKNYYFSYFSAWTAEANMVYAKDNSNSTVKGQYQTLDEKILYASARNYGSSDNSKDPNSGALDDCTTLCFYAFWENVGTSWDTPYQWVYNNYVQPLGVDSDDIEKYTLKSTFTLRDDNYVNGSDTSAINKQTYSEPQGFTYKKRAYGGSSTVTYTDGTYTDTIASYTVNFYYTRNSYSLTFSNNGTLTTALSVPYETDLSTYNVDVAQGANNYTFAQYMKNPPYPSNLEPNAYEFVGWYTTSECVAGTEVYYKDDSGKWSWKSEADKLMPANDLVLYAKYVPKTHTVRFFNTYDDMLKYRAALEAANGAEGNLVNDVKSLLIKKSNPVSHGTLISSGDIPDSNTITYTVNGLTLTFGGWFYMDGSSKLAYTPLSMKVNSDMYVFAEWGSNTPQPYLIHYALEDAEKDAGWLGVLNTATAGEDAVYEVKYNGETRRYLKEDDEKYHRCIADDNSGYGYQGSTRTFTAKAGNPYNQLDSGFNSGYYPTTATHSITIKAEAAGQKTAQNNVYTFHYVHVDNMSYTVNYLNADTKIAVADSITLNTTAAVVTERFVTVKDMIPDAFYKRLVLAVQKDESTEQWVPSDENVIEFYYTASTTQAYYAVHYMLQKSNLNDPLPNKITHENMDTYFDESETRIEGVADIGKETTVNMFEFNGFTLMSDNGYTVSQATKNESTGEYTYTYNYEDNETFSWQTTDTSTVYSATFTATAGGTELYIFYSRNTYPYTVYYAEFGTAVRDLINANDDTKNQMYTNYNNGTISALPARKDGGMKEYGHVVTESSLAVLGYTCISTSPQTLTIQDTDDNYIIFFYEKNEYAVEYNVVPSGAGTLSQTFVNFKAENVTTDSDGNVTVKNSSGTTTSYKKWSDFISSTPTAAAGWKFVGWYTDKDCTKPVDELMVSTDTLTPKYTSLKSLPEHNIYYAKFESTAVGSITINRTNAKDESSGDQVFTYEIKNSETGEIVYATIQTDEGSGSVKVNNLVLGTYTVTELESWSWRYGESSQTVELNDEQDGAHKTVTFSGETANGKWLSGNSGCKSNVAK